LPLIGPQKGPAPLFEQIWILIPQACFLPSLVEISLVVLEKKSFKGKSWRRTDDGRTLCHTISSHGLRPGELKIRHKIQGIFQIKSAYFTGLSVNCLSTFALYVQLFFSWIFKGFRYKIQEVLGLTRQDSTCHR